MLDNKKLIEKSELLNKVSDTLKSEFVGLDDIIDNVIYNFKSWFLFPELQTRPHIINLWGLTGTGKTSLVKRLCKLLNLERDMVYFNFAEIGEMSSWDIENKIEEQLSNERSNRIFIYDEFQYAATIAENGMEKDKKSGLKPFWELLDEGKLHKRDSFWSIRRIYSLMTYMKRLNSISPFIIENGVWVSAEECLAPFNHYERKRYSNLFRIPHKEENDEKQSGAGCDDCNEIVEYPSDESEDGKIFLYNDDITRIQNLYNKAYEDVKDDIEIYRMLKKMNYNEVVTFLENIYTSLEKGYNLNFSDSIIFVIGNLDEAYTVAFDTDPDMSPDQFHKITKDITVVDIKKALQKRFRNEQIARLGNVHLIYPSFSSNSFRQIIRLALDNYAKDVMEKIGYQITYANSIVDFIYNESVFPTHGTRPIFSSIYEIVKSKLPNIVTEAYTKKIDASIVHFSYQKKKIHVTIYDKKNVIISKLSYKEKTRISNLRDSVCDEEQAIVAVHESGHFAVYAALMNKIPEKLCSRTASSNTGGFLMNDYDDTKKLHGYNMILNKIKITLGGYCAEMMVFGKDFMTIGASSDLRQATLLASGLIREYGYIHPAVTTYLTESTTTLDGKLIKEDCQDDINKAIYQILDSCMAQAKHILETPGWRKLFKESSIYLSKNSSMSKKKMQEIYDSVPDEYKGDVIGETYYRDKIETI